ncbi:hypothetical protein FHS83_000864 [Rhizomicrobium palustre]|uniref:DUF2274 domain-containing protein n=1 Tax=Rhizomicrobium palustre TaxID=189966 RepID=A0A846MVZ4_9PROT|nr:DUF2274 domain-containing protein [Rhizomicrobium palustre]NIK87546.1 hypothetical protein [Rhizomicrobium palustre]
MDLKLSKLPDRMPVSLKITLKPDLHRRLLQYAECYRATYGGEGEPVDELIPFIIEAFLDSDRAFAKAMKSGELNAVSEAPMRRSRRRRGENGVGGSATSQGERNGGNRNTDTDA